MVHAVKKCCITIKPRAGTKHCNNKIVTNNFEYIRLHTWNKYLINLINST